MLDFYIFLTIKHSVSCDLTFQISKMGKWQNTLTVERPSGTYTFYRNSLVPRNEAEYECAKYNSILAPITEKSDFTALMEAFTKVSTEPDFYHVGLNIAKDGSGRVFGNGVPWDEEKHGSYHLEVERKVGADECRLI